MKKSLAVKVRSPQDADSLVSRLAVQPYSRTHGRPVLLRRDGRQLRKKTWGLDSGLCVELATHCARTGMDEQDVVAAALRKFLGLEG